MKKILGAFLIASTFIFASCSSGSESGTSVDNKQEEQSTTENTNSSGVKPVAPTLTEIAVPQNLKVELNSADVGGLKAKTYENVGKTPKVFFTVSWEPVENATEYYVYTAATNEFTEDTPLYKTVTEPSIQLELDLGEPKVELDNSYVAVKAYNSEYKLISNLSSSVTCISDFLNSAYFKTWKYHEHYEYVDGYQDGYSCKALPDAAKYKFILTIYNNTIKRVEPLKNDDRNYIWFVVRNSNNNNFRGRAYCNIAYSSIRVEYSYVCVTSLVYDSEDRLIGVSNRKGYWQNPSVASFD